MTAVPGGIRSAGDDPRTHELDRAQPEPSLAGLRPAVATQVNRPAETPFTVQS